MLADLFGLNNEEVTAEIGEKCPKGGLWYQQGGDPMETYAIGIDNKMPPIEGGGTWILGTPSGTGK
jgi:hypothetical protein